MLSGKNMKPKLGGEKPRLLELCLLYRQLSVIKSAMNATGDHKLEPIRGKTLAGRAGNPSNISQLKESGASPTYTDVMVERNRNMPYWGNSDVVGAKQMNKRMYWI